jgi:LPS-assembly protein
MTWPVFKVKGVPLIVLPALYWPLEQDQRSSGLLLPAIGTSSLRGFMFSQSAFWAISRSADATFTFDYFSKAGQGIGSEFRHAFMQEARGQARFYWLRGTRYTKEEIDAGLRPVPGGWSLNGSHHQYLGELFLLNINANFFSSQEFVRGFENGFNNLLQAVVGRLQLECGGRQQSHVLRQGLGRPPAPPGGRVPYPAGAPCGSAVLHHADLSGPPGA